MSNMSKTNYALLSQCVCSILSLLFSLEQVLWVLKKAGKHVKKNTQHYINHPKEAWEDLVEYVKENPKEFAFICTTIIGGILIIVVPLVIGFGPAGPILGSLAAGWQAGLGAVAAGSLFAVLQSLEMTGVFTGIGSALVALGISAPTTKRIRLSSSPDKLWFLREEHSTPEGSTTASLDTQSATRRILVTNSRSTYTMIWMKMDCPSRESIRSTP